MSEKSHSNVNPVIIAVFYQIVCNTMLLQTMKIGCYNMFQFMKERSHSNVRVVSVTVISKVICDSILFLFVKERSHSNVNRSSIAVIISEVETRHGKDATSHMEGFRAFCPP